MASSLRRSSGVSVTFFSFIDIITGVSGVLILVTLLLSTTIIPQDPPPDPTQPGALSTDEPDTGSRDKLNQLQDEIRRLSEENKALAKRLAEAQAIPNSSDLEDQIKELQAAIAAKQQQIEGLKIKIEDLKTAILQRDATLGLTELIRQIERLQGQLAAVQKEVNMAVQTMIRLEGDKKDAEARLLKVKSEKYKVWVIPERARTTKEPLLAVVSENLITIERFNLPGSKITLRGTDSPRQFEKALKEFRPLDYYIVFYVKPSGIASFEKLKEAAKNADFEVGYDALEEEKQVVFSNKE